MAENEPSSEVVAAGVSSHGQKLNVFQRIALFIRQVMAEMRKVIVPTRNELVRYTVVVLVFVAVMMAIVYGLDVLFSALTTWVFGTPGS